MTGIKDLKKSLIERIEIEEIAGPNYKANELDMVNYDYELGILVSVNEAKAIVEALSWLAYFDIKKMDVREFSAWELGVRMLSKSLEDLKLNKSARINQ
jgi:hypothetical protein